MSDGSKPRLTLRTAALIVAGNLIPVLGVLLLGWDAGQILILYWTETVIIGLLTLPRILTAQGPIAERAAFSGTSIAERIAMTIFFCIHFGLFCAGQGFFAAMLSAMAQLPDPGATIEGPDVVIRAILAGTDFRLAVAGVAVVQLFLFWREWIASGLWRTSEPKTEMGRPYGRIFVMQFAVIFGAFIMLALKLPSGMILILCAGKTILDLAAAREPKPAAAA